MAAEIIEEMGGGADKGDDDNTGDSEPDGHMFIIAHDWMM